LSSRTAWLEKVRSVAPAVQRAIPEIESGRRLPQPLVDQFVDLGLFRACLPPRLGGESLDLRSSVEVIEALSAIDGSTGWVAMIGMGTATIGGHLAPAAAAEVFGDPRTVAGGVFAPNGRAQRVDGGYRVTGRWPFASGCEHSAWLTGGVFVMTDDGPELHESGVPDLKLMLFAAQDVEIIDTWDVLGLRGTGSHDIAVDDVFVADELSFSFMGAPSSDDDPYSALPIPTPLSLMLSSVLLGIARGAIADVVDLAKDKTPAMSTTTLAKRAHVQIDLAEIDAKLRAARAYVLDAADELWSAATQRRELTAPERAIARGAAIHAAGVGADVVNSAYALAGGTSLRSSHPLQRRLRDVHAATQHAIVGRSSLELIGRILLGIATDPGML
jgi:alkylation response protein AidB-like acyl-CoA dehydrogenase